MRDLGPITAFAVAVARGYSGTKEQFETLQYQSGTNAIRAETGADESEDWAEVSEYWATRIGDAITDSEINEMLNS